MIYSTYNSNEHVITIYYKKAKYIIITLYICHIWIFNVVDIIMIVNVSGKILLFYKALKMKEKYDFMTHAIKNLKIVLCILFQRKYI